MASLYVPARGDVVWLDFDPQTGHEQAGRWPVLVLSAAACNTKSSLMLCCPVSSQVKGYPFEVPAAPAAGSRLAGVDRVAPAPGAWCGFEQQHRRAGLACRQRGAERGVAATDHQDIEHRCAAAIRGSAA